MSEEVIFCGDAHGMLNRLPETPLPVVQIGDLGAGFVPTPMLFYHTLKPNFNFIRGNHDCPDVCREHPRYLGEFGMAGPALGGFFFVSGAFSIDRHCRIPGVSWWNDEELGMSELRVAIDMYEKERPEMVVTHEAPERIGRALLAKIAPQERYQPSRTALALEAMLSAHAPKLWIFGHWHVGMDEVIDGTRFICLDELATYRHAPMTQNP